MGWTNWMRSLGGVVVAGFLLSGCDLSKLSLDDIIDACDGMTVEEIMVSGALTDECREALTAFLPERETSHLDRIYVLGADRAGDNALVYVHGIGEDSSILTATDFADATVTPIRADGSDALMSVGSVSSEQLGPDYGDVLSVSFVTDYSGSMRDEDLELIADLHADLVNGLPEVYEAEVVLFSTEVDRKVAFTEDQDKLLGALALDTSYERDSTALYDGMGKGVDGLSSRTRPARLMIVATDGAENDSIEWRRSELVEAMKDEDIYVVMIGSLFSDLEELQALTRGRGVYFYAADYLWIQSEVETWIESISTSTALRIEGLPSDTTGVRIEVAGKSATVTF